MESLGIASLWQTLRGRPRDVEAAGTLVEALNMAFDERRNALVELVALGECAVGDRVGEMLTILCRMVGAGSSLDGSGASSPRLMKAFGNLGCHLILMSPRPDRILLQFAWMMLSRVDLAPRIRGKLLSNVSPFLDNPIAHQILGRMPHMEAGESREEIYAAVSRAYVEAARNDRLWTPSMEYLFGTEDPLPTEDDLRVAQDPSGEHVGSGV